MKGIIHRIDVSGSQQSLSDVRPADGATGPFPDINEIERSTALGG